MIYIDLYSYIKMHHDLNKTRQKSHRDTWVGHEIAQLTLLYLSPSPVPFATPSTTP